jgi:DNA-binding transcriptional regulator GbsR (MarR family)
MSTTIENIFGRTAQTTVLLNLIEKDDVTYASGIAEETGISYSSVSRVLAPLIKQDIVKEKVLGKQVKSFQLNKENEITKAILEFVEKVSNT